MLNKLSWFDRIIVEVDTALRTILPPSSRVSQRPFPGENLENGMLTRAQVRHAIGLMRVNHSGEVCAQALYQGQAFTASGSKIEAQLREAANEEVEHLAWCERRLNELGGHVSVLNLGWYMASLMLGATVGLMGDRISLGFVAEVERQVEAHLATHLNILPEEDKRSHAVLKQMKIDERRHAHAAISSGGMLFPYIIQLLMQCAAKGMTRSSYYL